MQHASCQIITCKKYTIPDTTCLGLPYLPTLGCLGGSMQVYIIYRNTEEERVVKKFVACEWHSDQRLLLMGRSCIDPDPAQLVKEGDLEEMSEEAGRLSTRGSYNELESAGADYLYRSRKWIEQLLHSKSNEFNFNPFCMHTTQSVYSIHSRSGRMQKHTGWCFAGILSGFLNINVSLVRIQLSWVSPNPNRNITTPYPSADVHLVLHQEKTSSIAGKR